MNKHNGMRPQDIPILLKIASKSRTEWYMKDVAYEIKISGSEISESINRSLLAGLISRDKKSLKNLAILEFLFYGLRYVYPVKAGSITRGIATAHSAPPLKNIISSQEIYIWPYANGQKRGQSIEPLYPTIPEACLKDNTFYELVALTDALRVGKTRERKIAFDLLKEKLEFLQNNNNENSRD